MPINVLEFLATENALFERSGTDSWRRRRRGRAQKVGGLDVGIVSRAVDDGHIRLHVKYAAAVSGTVVVVVQDGGGRGGTGVRLRFTDPRGVAASGLRRALILPTGVGNASSLVPLAASPAPAAAASGGCRADCGGRCCLSSPDRRVEAILGDYLAWVATCRIKILWSCGFVFVGKELGANAFRQIS